MTLGNLVALWQQNIRRLLAYSSIAHAGYMMIGVAVGLAVAGGAEGDEDGRRHRGMLFYVLVYAVATLGAFALLAWLGEAIGKSTPSTIWPACGAIILGPPP